jgi:hypothetical protein
MFEKLRNGNIRIIFENNQKWRKDLGYALKKIKEKKDYDKEESS